MSLTLPANLISAVTIGGVQTESDPNAAITDLQADYLTNMLTFSVRQGTTAGANFSIGQAPPSYQFIINCVTGAWRVIGSGISGTLAGASLTSIQSIFKTLRNNGETFVINQNLFPGATQQNW